MTEQSVPNHLGNLLREAHNAAAEYQRAELAHIPHPSAPDTSIPVIMSAAGATIISKQSIADYLDHPERRTGTALMTRLESFVEHVNRFKNDDSAVFANDSRVTPGLTAVLDYHDCGSEGTPRHGDHRTRFDFPLSDEWKLWMECNGQKMTMVEFAEFLEERVTDIDTVESYDDLNEDIQRFIGATGLDKIAAPSRLIELSRNLQVHESSVIKQVQNLSSGEGVLRFESEHTDAAGQPVDVPGLFIICIPVFAHDGYYRIAARLRYRKTGSGIVFWYDLWRTDLVFDHAFNQACERVRDETSLPLLIGAPE